MTAYQNDWIVVYNPRAGKNSRRSRQKLIQAFERAGIGTHLIEAADKSAAMAEAHRMIDGGYNQFMAVGGDGTNNTLVNVLMERNDPQRPFSYALLPWGTGNDWAMYHKLSKRPAAIIRAIKEQHFSQVDIGVIDFDQAEKPIYFTNAVGMGFDAFVVEKMQNESKVGRMSYLAEVVRSMGKYQSVDLSWIASDQLQSAEVFSFHIGLGVSAGGGLKILPQADARKGQLAFTVIREDSRYKYFRNLINVLRGTISHLDFVDLSHAEQIRFPEQTIPHVLECDGEKCGSGPCTIRIHGHQLKLLMSVSA